jgi:hypothetical protein
MGFQTLTNIVNVVANDSIPPFYRMLQVITNNGFAPVGTDNIQNEAITSNKIANGAITNAKLSLIDTQ